MTDPVAASIPNRLKLYAAVYCGLYPVSCRLFSVCSRLLSENRHLQTPATLVIFALAILAFGVSNYGVTNALVRLVPQRLRDRFVGGVILLAIIGMAGLLFLNSLPFMFGDRFYPIESPAVRCIPTIMAGIALWLGLSYVRVRCAIQSMLPIARVA